ncbi:copper amine oxidase N-terminal domain-containing protein [Brevibacillus agri]|uniref:copper amine oxidase N-terminal domain-containing protein n=1 Tax=Brevibacillus TaxID=55080 RepID=UPI000419FF25|nr:MULTISPECIES: copper amine oxidase N-terminal domain-containing protein [Brevibacillus]MED1644645.1 copper amine oxidase N-terminal domain-containing protein [Brevibacillus agri]MED1655602.1 copper amine oxidase N-terminal domain-containing protein [Brevibacillus agri]MED1689119.1 copper amine oxidase N-terminal domain-containing protein [Brevibacillus agri]MED1691378.1 copper amine oxidase N-terminal domain-containing protein [Brevibacillus agri]MED1696101.1 copper amine oxidase N-terminal
MKKSKKALPIVLASALAATPFVAVPQEAHALKKVSVKADNDGADKDSSYDISFTLEEDLTKGDTITIEFDSEYTVSKSISSSDIDASFKVKSAKASGKKVIITLNEDLEEGDKVTITIEDGITNPEDKGTYDVYVSTSSEDEEYGEVTIKSSSSSSSSSKDYSVSLSSKAAGEATSVKLGKISLKGSDELETNEYITVIFPDEDMLPSKIDAGDVKLNGYSVKTVSVKDDEVEIKVPSSVAGDDYITLEFSKSAGIENPSAGSKYTYKVKYDGVTYESEQFEITKSGSSTSTATNSFTVNLSDPSAGARSSYTFDADFGSKQLKADEELVLEFPSADMVPGILSASDFTLNGKTAKRVSASGNKVYITAPSNFSATSEVKVVVSFSAWITNPKTAGSYTLKATAAGRTLESKSFTIGGSVVNPTPNPAPTPTPTPTPNNTVNNSTATIALTSTALGKPTGVNVAIKGLGVGLVKQRDFVELVFPAGYKVPAYIAPANVTVNGVAANYVAVRGQNVLIYPSQDIPAATAANISINAAANIVNPAVKNTYSISVFTSEEKGLLFARAVGVGMPAPAQPAPQPTPQPQQPAVTVPTNAALFKVNTANFTLHGKTYPLQVAPYIANGNTTMVPAQFFKEALALTTQWNNSTVAIISGTKVMKFTVGSNKARVGNQEITLPTPVVLKNGMPMIPVRTVTDNLGYKVGWDAKTSSVFVYK